MIVKTYKYNRRTICYVSEFKGRYTVSTGKPSDAYCISWKYDNLKDAEKTAEEYIKNYKMILPVF